MNSLELLLSRWRNEDVGPRPPESEEAIRIAFAAAGYQASSDVVRLYRAIGGMDVGDNVLWRLWPLDEIASQEPSDRGVLFSDYILSSWSYRLLPVSDEVSAVYVDYFDESAPTLVASSLEEFFEKYVNDALLLLDPKAHR